MSKFYPEAESKAYEISEDIERPNAPYGVEKRVISTVDEAQNAQELAELYSRTHQCFTNVWSKPDQRYIGIYNKGIRVD